MSQIFVTVGMIHGGCAIVVSGVNGSGAGVGYSFGSLTEASKFLGLNTDIRRPLTSADVNGSVGPLWPTGEFQKALEAKKTTKPSA